MPGTPARAYATHPRSLWLSARLRSFISIPQQDKTDQGLAIQSITSYVGLSDLFIVLAGPWQHVDDGSIRDVRAWGERGWVRGSRQPEAVDRRRACLFACCYRRIPQPLT